MHRLMDRLQYKTLSRFLTAALFIGAGVLHFINTAFFVAIVPPVLPHPAALVYISGICEILGGIGLLVPRCRRPAGVGLILLLIAVFPANINMFAQSLHTQGLSVTSMLLASRLPIQVVLIALVNWVSKEPAYK
jgi:uncharacterized membrane protein